MRSRGTAARARATLTAVAVVATLAACTSEEPGPGPTASQGPVSVSPSPEVTASETPAPETIAPERPEAMDDDGVAGAEATARYFLELYPYVYATGDLSEWKALSHKDCVFCNSVTSNVNDLLASGHHNRGSEVTWESLEAWHVDESLYGAEGRLVEGPSATYDADGVPVGSRETTLIYDLVFALERTADGWTVREVDVTEKPA